MGTDIHMVVQAELSKGEWAIVPLRAYRERNYPIFGLLARCRK